MTLKCGGFLKGCTILLYSGVEVELSLKQRGKLKGTHIMSLYNSLG